LSYEERSVTETTARRVTAQLHARAREPVEQLVRTLALIKSPPELSATVMEHMAKLALDMASYYRSKAALEDVGRD
jgi:hypothetical protein